MCKRRLAIEIEPNYHVYSRGFPYQKRQQRTEVTYTEEKGSVRLNAGLWLREPDRYLIQTSLPNNPLNPGLFTLYVGACCANKSLDYFPNVMSFQVKRTDRQQSLWLKARSGALSLDSEWSRPMRKSEEGVDRL